MPADPSLYPPEWRTVAAKVRERAGHRCECAGECGLHQGRRCVEVHGKDAVWARGRVVLTSAHLNAPGGPCTCDPLCADPEHLRSMCQRCHLRYDRPRHAQSARENRDRKDGVLRLFGGGK